MTPDMLNRGDPTQQHGPAAPAAPESASIGGDICQLESYVVDVLQATHPLRLGLALRRAEETARACWPREQVNAVFERAILLALRQDDA